MSNVAGIKKKLLQRKIELEEALKRLSQETFNDGQLADTADQVSISTMEDLTISLQNTELIEYKKILKALEMLEVGTYGICSECGQPISEKRLSLYPNATRCIACQEALEETQSR